MNTDKGRGQAVVVWRPRPAQLAGVCYSGILLYGLGVLAVVVATANPWWGLAAVPLHLAARRLDRVNPWWSDEFREALTRQRGEDR